MGRPSINEPRDSIASLRLTLGEREEIKKTSKALGFRSISDYMRHLHRESAMKLGAAALSHSDREDGYGPLQEELRTDFGRILQGNSLAYLLRRARPESVNLIVTSPPFGLIRKKSYGNEDADAYCEWFRPFAKGFLRVLKDDGSLVIDIGGAWKQGQPTRSLYHFKLLIMLCEEFGFHLAQEHYWWNPAKLPTPVEWVNVRRLRVKDAVNCIWWLSKTPFPKANNRRVLSPYSESMKRLLKNGYNAGKRPSGHDISEKFGVNNGGSVPPNLLAIANTESTGQYQEHCIRNNLPIHPARFPSLLPEYFIRFLTDPGDLVVDPFAGSCITGMVAEDLKRKWVCIERSQEYIDGGLGRFDSSVKEKGRQRSASYSISAPCSQPVIDDEYPLTSGKAPTSGAIANAKSSNDY